MADKSETAKFHGKPLRTAEAIYLDLMGNQQLITVSAAKSIEIWKLFRGKGEKLTPDMITLSYRAFLQAALISAIDASFAMGWVETVFRSTANPSTTVKDLLKDLTKHAFKILYRSWKNEPPVLYKVVISDIAWSHRTYFDMIADGMEL